MLSASAIEIDGERAFAETPHSALVHVDIADPGCHGIIEIATHGWYLDLFSRRAGEWKIDFQRVVTFQTATRLIPADRAPAPVGHDDFALGIRLADETPDPSHVTDVAELIRQTFRKETTFSRGRAA